MDTVVGLLIIAVIAEAAAIAILRQRLYELECNLLRLALVRRQNGEPIAPVHAVMTVDEKKALDALVVPEMTETP